MEMFVSLVLTGAGFVMLLKGADWFVDGASQIAEKFKIPQLVIGLTIVAMGTSAPEAAVSIAAALKGNAEITVGNIVGSNILNVLLILGISAVIAPLAVAKTTIRYEIPFMILITFLMLLLGMGGDIGFWDGIILILLFLAYLGYLLLMAKKKEQVPEASGKKHRLWQSVLFAALGMFAIVGGSHVLVDAVSKLARLWGMSERFIGLTIVALGTSLPELFTSVAASRKGNADIAVGNIVGSNIFNILFVVGISALITPVSFAADFYGDTLAAAAAGILLLLCAVWKKKLGRWSGAVMLAMYGVYFAFVCM